MSKVLLPTDGSPSSIIAAEYATSLMKLISSLELTILAVEDNQFEAEEVIKRTKAIFDREGFVVKTIINKGEEEVGEIITYYANNGPFDHIIMGRRGLNRVQDIILGSVSQSVIHKAKCPVTLVPLNTKTVKC